MAVVNQNYDIDLEATGEYPVVKMSQFDTGSRTIVFTVYHGRDLARLDGMGARVDGTRTDGGKFSVACAMGTGSKVSFAINQEMTKCAGKHTAELVISDADGNPAGTQNFIIEVEEAPMARDAAASTDDRTLYDQLAGSVTKIVSDKMASVDTKMASVDTKLASMGKAVSDKLASVDAKMADVDNQITAAVDKRYDELINSAPYEIGSGLTKGTWYDDYTWKYCRLRVLGGVCTLSFRATRKSSKWDAHAWNEAHVLTLPTGSGILGELNVPIVTNANSEPNNNTALHIDGSQVSFRPTVDVSYGVGTWFQGSVSWVAAGTQSADVSSEPDDSTVTGGGDMVVYDPS